MSTVFCVTSSTLVQNIMLSFTNFEESCWNLRFWLYTIGYNQMLKSSKIGYNWIFQIIIRCYNWIFLISVVLFFVFYLFVCLFSLFLFCCCCCCCFLGVFWARVYRRMIFVETSSVCKGCSRTRIRHSKYTSLEF